VQNDVQSCYRKPIGSHRNAGHDDYAILKELSHYYSSIPGVEMIRSDNEFPFSIQGRPEPKKCLFLRPITFATFPQATAIANGDFT
jgi:hypothetical protein